MRLETDKQASYHQNLAKQIRDDLEAPTANFVARQAHHKKTFQAAIEKKFKTKQQQEFHVNQAGEKYKSDCLRINSYTAQSTLMQGKELDKIHVKLERAQQTVQANERDYANFAKNLQTTVSEWEQDWKVFCDSCQDQEEERMEFIKDTMWAYANAVSTVCVSDDEVSVSACATCIYADSWGSLVRKCVSHLNKWNLIRTWRTLCETTGQAMPFPTLPLSLTTIIPKRCLQDPLAPLRDLRNFLVHHRDHFHLDNHLHHRKKNHSSTLQVLARLVVRGHQIL